MDTGKKVLLSQEAEKSEMIIKKRSTEQVVSSEMKQPVSGDRVTLMQTSLLAKVAITYRTDEVFHP